MLRDEQNWIGGRLNNPRAWARGSQGEQVLAKALAGVEGIRILHARRVPGTRGNIAHIVNGER